MVLYTDAKSFNTITTKRLLNTSLHDVDIKYIAITGAQERSLVN